MNEYQDFIYQMLHNVLQLIEDKIFSCIVQQMHKNLATVSILCSSQKFKLFKIFYFSVCHVNVIREVKNKKLKAGKFRK